MIKKLITFALLFTITGSVLAEISVKSFRKLENDLDARLNESVKDQNGYLCAIIKVVTSQTGFTYDCGQIGIMKTVQKTGEIWVYVPFSTKRITIAHPVLGFLRDYMFPMPVEKATVYELVLTTDKIVTTIEKNEIETQWLLINTEPTGADVYVNDQPVGKTPYQNEFPIGKYTYRLQKELYLNEAGIVELKAGDQKQIIKIQLKPNFGTLQISSTPENGAKVSLDGIPTGKVTPCTIDMVPTGEHTVKVSNDMYETTSNKVTVNPAESKQIIINMNSAFSEVTLQSEPKADIYINGVFKANGLWQGRLTPAVYSFEAKLDKYKTAFEKQTVETGIPVNLTLRPKPRTGNLKVISTPFEAFIKLNGKEMGQTPKTINSLLIGDYNVELSLPGYAPYIGKQTVVEDQTVILNTSLENGRSVTISSTPSGSTIYIDGVVSGTTPYNGNLNFGDHKVAIEHNGKRIEKTISVSQSGETNFNLSMNLDNINITTSPTGADVYIDNVFSGKSPLAVELAYGSHNLKFVKDDKSITDRIDFNTKSNKTIFYELSECNSTKQIISTPTGANVLINNELVGITPYYFGMKQKQVSVALKKEGYNTYNGTLNCSDNSFSGYLSQKKKFDASNLFSFGMPVEIGLDGQDEVFLGLGFGLNIRIAPWLFIQNTLNLDYSFSDVMYLTGNHTICAGFPFSSSDEDILFAEYGIGYDIINGPTYNIFGLGYGTHKTNMTLRYKELIGLELAFRIEI